MRQQRWTGMRLGIALGLAAIFGSTLAGAARAQVPSLTKQAELTLNRRGGFGRAVALSADGRTALVAAEYSPDCPGPRGCTIGYVYVLRSGAWSLQGTLDHPMIGGNDYYNPAVSLSEDGSTALVGLRNRDCGMLQDACGSALLFVRNGETWSLRQEIRADAAELEMFGASVSLSGDGSVALVGAPWKNCAQELCGAAYVFSQTGGLWLQTARMTASDGGYQEYFGSAVSLSQDGATALIGAPGDKRDGQCAAPYRCGAAYVFTAQGNTWHEDQKLVASNATTNDLFGISVSLSGDGSTAAIGNLGIQRGDAYVFTRTGGVWAERQILPHPPSPYFGFSVGLSHAGETLLVGDITGDFFCVPHACRPARLFQKQGAAWTETQTFYGSDPQGGNSFFGHTVGISGSGHTVIVGSSAQFCSEGPNAGSSGCGAAYLYGAPGIAEVPAVSPLGLAMLALLLAGSGLYAARRRGARS